MTDEDLRKFRREIAEEARDFAMHWRLAQTYAEAGNSEMAKCILDAAPISKREHSPEERAQFTQWMSEALQRIAERDGERVMQGLPPLEPKPPEIH